MSSFFFRKQNENGEDDVSSVDVLDVTFDMN